MFSFVRTNRQTDSHNKDKQLNVLKGASKTNPSALSFFFYKTLRKVSSFWTVCRLIYIENSGFWEGILAQIPGARRGFLKSPRAARRARGPERRPEWGAKRRTEAGAEARGRGELPEGIFKIPERAMGIWGKSPIKNPNFIHIFCTDLPPVRNYFSTKIMPQLACY